MQPVLAAILRTRAESKQSPRPTALAFIAGLLSFLSPCVLPLAPAYVGYLGGTAMVTAEGVVVSDRRATLIHAASFIIGFSAVFVVLGASIGLIGYLVAETAEPPAEPGVHHQWVVPDRDGNHRVHQRHRQAERLVLPRLGV